MREARLTKDTPLEVQQHPRITNVHRLAKNIDGERMRNGRTSVQEDQE